MYTEKLTIKERGSQYSNLRFGRVSNKTGLRTGILFIVLFSLFICNCDLFSPADRNFIDDLYAELDWANAEKLNVTITHPLDWGQSTVIGTSCKGYDIRAGYPFEVEFVPHTAYAQIEWRAYATGSLPSNWLFENDPLYRFSSRSMSPIPERIPESACVRSEICKR